MILLCIIINRSLLNSETYLVVMNVGSKDEHVDLSKTTVIQDENWIVHTPSINSQHPIG